MPAKFTNLIMKIEIAIVIIILQLFIKTIYILIVEYTNMNVKLLIVCLDF